MAKTVAEEYRRIRRKYYWLSANQAILWARGNVKPTELDWTIDYGRHVATGKTTRDGFDIVVTVDDDVYPTRHVEETDANTGIRNPNFRWEGDEYDSRRHQRYLSLESDSTVPDLAEEYHRRGDARNVAWERARVSLQEEAEGYLSNESNEFIMTATVYLGGAELGTDSLGGCDVDPIEDLEKQFDNIVLENSIIEEAMDQAVKELKELDAKIHASGVLTTV
jgi:hypothetical protein